MTIPTPIAAGLPDQATAGHLLAPPVNPLIEEVDRVDSTNRFLLDEPFGDAPGMPRVLCALEQTAGRGRRGRAWLAEPGRSLCFSLAIESYPARVDPSLSLAVGLTVAQTLSPICDAITLKWPNDLLRRGAKCGGILVERRQTTREGEVIERRVIGVGLNLLRPDDREGLIEQPAEGLFDRREDLPPRRDLLARLAQAMLAAEQRHRLEGFAPWARIWPDFDGWIGRLVQITDAGRLIAIGEHRGVAADGSLLLVCNGQEQRIASGDVSLRESGAGRDAEPARRLHGSAGK
jgi:BirA family biotin operon repressor/biotin-[acetyl-CoA-carboxylase] ligase